MFVSGCFVLGVEKLVSQCVAGFEMYRDAVFAEDPPELFRLSHNIQKDNIVLFTLLFFLCLL